MRSHRQQSTRSHRKQSTRSRTTTGAEQVRLRVRGAGAAEAVSACCPHSLPPLLPIKQIAPFFSARASKTSNKASKL